MPNYCSNVLTVTPAVGELLSDNVALAMFRPLRKDETCSPESVEPLSVSFELAFPVPDALENNGGWFEWCVKNWGTKWDASSTFVEEKTLDKIRVRFDTAWSPPFGWVEFMSKLFPNVSFRLDYIEEGNSFTGFTIIQNGKAIDSYESNDITREDYERVGWDVEDYAYFYEDEEE